MKELLCYPFESRVIRRKKLGLRQELLEQENLISKNIAILGGSTTNDIKDILELFLLNYGFKPFFYESEFGQYWQDVMFDNEKLVEFKPDIIFIHTSNRNILEWPDVSMSAEEIKDRLYSQYSHFCSMWEKIALTFKCPVIQNNFEYPFYRLLGNMDGTDFRGRTNFITRLNQLFYEYASNHNGFYINDINWQSADYGLQKWLDPFYWHMYKYSLNIDAIPILAFNVANIIKSIYGKNKKALAIDLDNTIWGGIVGDDGVEGIEIGNETANGQVYAEFQEYLLELKKQGILLNVISKNEYDTAMDGIHHPEMLLKEEDFISVKANWEPKSINLKSMAEEINIGVDSFVFLDDNPAEREIIRQQVPDVGIPHLDKVEHYIIEIDRAGYFEATGISVDDFKRSEMYRENVKRMRMQNSFSDYRAYLKSLKMEAVIKPFEKVYMQRISQLTNKSNQFNLTTQRYSQEDMERMAGDTEHFITLYGKLSDCFGDNGVVAISIGQIVNGMEVGQGDEKVLNIILWLMSCRVLKRNMEFAMMDEMVRQCKNRGIGKIIGNYYPTLKNKMVKDFYGTEGFQKVSEDFEGNSKWILDIKNGYREQNNIICIKRN